MGDLWKASARGWGWAVESRSSQRSGGGGTRGEQGAGGGRETGEERAGSGISRMGGKQDRIQKGKLSLFVLIIQSKKRTQQQPPPHPPPPPPPPPI